MFERSVRVIAVLGLLLVGQACGKTIDPPAGTNTNWLGTCEDDGDCSDGNECICGVCTRFCSGASQCAALDGARCMDVAECGGAADDEPASQAACLLGCDRDDDCRAVANGECREGVCLPRITVGGSAGSSAPSPDAAIPGNPDGGPGIDPYALVRNDREVEIGAAYLTCAVDEHCVLVGTGCDGCCQWGAIDADLKATFEENFGRACAGYNGPECDCEYKPTVATCVAGTCRAVEACISPTQYPQRAYDVGAQGCPCDQPEDSICIGGAALICGPGSGGHTWRAVEDGPCEPRVGDDVCQPDRLRDDPAACLATYTTCRELPNGEFCGEGCHEPLDCTQFSCAPYAPFPASECTGGFDIYEGLCDGGALRYRIDQGGYGGGTRFWIAATGALVAYQGAADYPAFCDNMSNEAELGDRDAIRRCKADENTREQICTR